MATRSNASGKGSGKSFLLLLLTLLSTSKFSAALDPNACPYDFTVLKRLGHTDYTDFPLRILRQSGSTVEFTVGNTWTTAAGDAIDQIFVSYAGDETGSKACDLSENVPTMQSIDSKLTAYCTPNGVAMVRLYVRDSSFDIVKDTATIPECCVDPNNNPSSPPALEYLAVLNCNPTCGGATEVEVRIGNQINDPFELVYLTDVPSGAPVAPTDAPASTPSSTPSSQPTSIVQATCPPVGGDPILVDVSFGAVLDIDNLGATDSVCALVEMWIGVNDEPTHGLIPVGRSYGGNQWEASAGPFSHYDWNCDNNSCNIYLPEPETGRSFMLVTYSHTHSYSAQDDIARFLEKTTFGPTRDEIFDGSFPGKTAWMQQQFDMPASSHRQYYRERISNWRHFSSLHGMLKHSPCDVGARYRKYAFLTNDRDRYVSFEESPTDASKAMMFINGFPVTVVNKPVEYADNDDGPTGVLDISKAYRVVPYPLEGVGGRVRFYLSGASNSKHIYFGGVYGNPAIWFDEDHLSYVQEIIELDPGNYAEILPQMSFYGNAEVLQVSSPLPESSCNLTDGAILGYPERSIFGRTASTGVNGTEEYWLHTATFDLQNNDLATPLLDGGKPAVELTKEAVGDDLKRYRAYCSSAPRTFLNEDHCVLSDDACYRLEGSDKDIDLTEANLIKIYHNSGGEFGEDTRYVYIITGLRNEPSEMAPIDSPCTPDARSRWLKSEGGNCTGGTPWDATTESLFRTLIPLAGDSNPYMTDVFFPTTGSACHSDDQEEYDFKIEIDGVCYTNTHPDNYQVMDMTYWTTDAHMGNKNENKIKKFAEVFGTWYLTFPGWHEMRRWHENKHNFPLVGRFGDTTSIKQLPSSLLREDIAHGFGSAKAATFNEKVVVCGSPYEVANEPTIENGPIRRGGFDMRVNYNNTSAGGWLTEQKNSAFLAQALWAPDQLRQRMAFALSQILVVSPTAGSGDYTESYLSYYDIFVRHAFGNYLDILREVTYHPLMSIMLTYKDGLSTAYSKVKKSLVQQADENYAREIMQLFTIGLYKLNIDGTTQLGDDGKEILTYSNFDIAEYAKVYTGFEQQDHRGNIDGTNNQIDPLETKAYYKDHLPKMGLDSQYIGDGYPLCSDLPDQHFLKKGATYLLLGADPNPSLLQDPSQWYRAKPKRLSLDFSSPLAQYLCNSDGNACNPQGKVILDQDIACTGIECDIDTPRTFEVADGLWFEYVRPACVNPAYYENAQSIRKMWSGDWWYYACGNPINAEASTACCKNDTTSDSADRFELFSGERVTLSESTDRCSGSDNLRLCSNPSISNNDCWNLDEGGCDVYNKFYWTNNLCTLQAKITPDGRIGIVHKHHIPGVDYTEAGEDHVWKTFKQVDQKTIAYFQGDWQSDIDAFLDDYSGSCAAAGCFTNEFDGVCICNVTLYESAAFASSAELVSAQNVLSRATYGVFESIYSQENFKPTGIENIEVNTAAGAYTMDTIFKVVDSNGITRYRKNVASSSELGNGGPILRTPVSFWSLAEYTERDARYELNAALEHYFYHQNTAPFLAIRFAQRFGISNPSPRYIKEIATAFRTGNYNGFGSNEYGCLKATIAAVILDREAQDSSLDLDPTHGQLKEPYLKLIQLMRSLEYTPDVDRPIPSFWTDLQSRLGQEAHKMPSVFSFFMPQFSPTGPVESAGLVSPEAQILNGPLVINLLNLFRSYLKYGLTRCYDGFGTYKERTDGGASDKCSIGDESTSHGNSRYLPSSSLNASLSQDVVDELATVLTAGRLSPENRAIIKTAFDYTLENGKGEYEAMINAQQVIATAPEFHSTGLTRKLPTERTFEGPGNATGIPYKSIIYFMLPGGLDSWHVLAPESCTGVNSKNETVLEQYLSQRGVMAFDRDEGEFDLKISPNTDQPCESFAIHKSLPYVHKMYNDGDLLFVANAGVINQQEMTTKSWDDVTRTRLFDHGGMQRETKKVDPYDDKVGTGVLGRAKDVLTENGHIVNALGINVASVALKGVPGVSKPVSTVSENGVKEYGSRPGEEAYFEIEDYTSMVNSATTPFTNVFAETYSNTLVSGFDESSELSTFLAKASLLPAWPEKPNGFTKRMRTVTELMQTRGDRNADRDVYYVEHGGWDHHSNMKSEMEWRLAEVNYNLELLVEQIKADGLWDSTTIVVASEFARTITPNSNAGSDHAWGGNYFLMGGAVKGGRVLGEYPDDFTTDSPLNGSRNIRVRFIPTTSWDSIWHGVLQWFGVEDDADLDYCLPNKDNTAPHPVEGRGSFPLLEKTDLFEDPSSSSMASPPDAPTGAPTGSSSNSTANEDCVGC